jgi:predicted HD phosphohydrolase
MLPIGANVEAQNEKKDLWTFVIFVAALLHDIGKTVSDVNIMLYDVKHKFCTQIASRSIE